MTDPLDTLTAILAKQDDRLARQDEILATMHQHLARQEEHRAQHDAYMAKMDEHLVHQDAMLAKMDDHLAQHDETLARLITLTDIARQEATAAHQAMAVALQRYAETRLDVDHFIATAERVLATWERQARAP